MSAKQRRFLFVLVSALLLLCLACLEIPEMSTLTDDVSNDFTILVHGSSATQIVVCAKLARTISPQPAAAKSVEFGQFAVEKATEEVAHPCSRDLLALHSLRRT